MPEDTPRGIQKPLDSDKPPSIQAAVGPAFDKIDELFGAIDLSQLVAPKADDGKILIVNEGAAAYTAMKGDATIAEDGTLTIGAAKIGTNKLVDKAATTAKIDDEAVTEGKLEDGSVGRKKLAIASFKTARLSTGSIAAGAETTVKVTWAEAFADAGYSISVVVGTGTVDGKTDKPFLEVKFIDEQLPGSLLVVVKNPGAGPLTGLLHVMAWHD